MHTRERRLRRTRWVTRGVLAIGTVGAIGASGAIALAATPTAATDEESRHRSGPGRRRRRWLARP